MNAATQYFSFCLFQELVNNKNQYQQRILDFFNSIKDELITHESYVIDLLVVKERILIIELNPFVNIDFFLKE